MSLEDRIKYAFRADASLIDNPVNLLYRVWLDHCPIEFRMLSMNEFMRRVINGDIDMPNPMTINRVRQEIQETNPEFEGKMREKRKEKAAEIANEIHNNKFENIS